MTAQLIFMMREFVERETIKRRDKPDDDNGPLSFFITNT